MALNERDTRDPRLERLYREAASEAPPAHLDAAILAAARRDVGARPRSLSTALRRWQVPVSIAAVVVVGVSLVTLMMEEGVDRLGEIGIPPVTAPADKPVSELKQAPPAAAASSAAQQQVESRARAEQEASRDDSKRAVELGKMEVTSPRTGDSAAISGLGAAMPGPAAEPLPKPFVAAPPVVVQERAATPKPADTAAAGRLEAASPVPGERRSPTPSTDAPQPKIMARAMVAKPAVSDRPPVWQGLEKEPPEKWMVRIEELVREGQATEAEELRAEFKRRFPDHPLGRAAK